MSDLITVTGVVGTEPKHIVTSTGLPVTNFRLASTARRFDRAQGRWVDGETNWYTVAAFRQLAANVAASVSKGDPVIVTGRLRVKPWENAERSGVSVDIDADAVGHDLGWGTARFVRAASSRQGDDAPDRVEATPEPGGEVVDAAEPVDDGRSREAVTPF